MKSRQYQGFIVAASLVVSVLFAVASPAQRTVRRSARVISDAVAQNSYVPGELLVKMKSGIYNRSAAEANAVVGARVIEHLAQPDWDRVQLPDGLSVNAAMAVYKTLDNVEYVQPNYYYHLLATPNDPDYLTNINSTMYGMGRISAPAAWDLSTGSQSVVVADIDTGVRYTHVDLVSNLWRNPNEIGGNGIDDDANGFVDDVYGADLRDNDGDPSDPNGHGTHTAGIIGASGNNGLNVVGVNWNVKIMAVKIYNAGGLDTTSSMLVNAYNYVAMMKSRGVNIRATNNSYGGCGEACGYDQATKDAIDALGDLGIVNVFAAGNDNHNNDVNPSTSYPSVYTSPSIIAVAASDGNDVKAEFSSYGAQTVDLAAPGGGNGWSILSTWNSDDTALNAIRGTSMATPHVTGAIALLAAYRPELSPESLKASILNNVDVLPNWSGIVKTGGRLNVLKAMQNPTVCSFTTSVNAIRLRSRAQSLTLPVSAAANCDYMAKSTAPWLNITGNNVFSSNGTITYTVSANTTGAPRTATIYFGGRAFVVRQQAGTRG